MKTKVLAALLMVTGATAWGQNYLAAPLGNYGPAYDAGTTIASGGSILVGSGGIWGMGGNLISADKGGSNTPSATGRAEAIIFDGTGTYTGGATTPGVTGNIIDGYATASNQTGGFVLPIGSGSLAYPLTVPAGQAVTAAYFPGSGSTQFVPVNNISTTEFSHYYDMPLGTPAGSYIFSYPAGLASGNNSLLSSNNSSAGGTTSGTSYSLLTALSNLTVTAGTTTATLATSATPTQLYMSSSQFSLPITLVSFTGSKSTSGNLLNWAITDAVNFSHFELQRHTDGGNFATIARIPYVNGTSAYNYVDANTTGTNYYRLSLVDLDGKFTYSKTVLVVGDASNFSVLGLYPNPATTTLNVSLFVPASTSVVYTVTDMGGRVLSSETHSANATTMQPLNVSGLAKGTYVLTIDAGNGTKANRKFTKL